MYWNLTDVDIEKKCDDACGCTTVRGISMKCGRAKVHNSVDVCVDIIETKVDSHRDENNEFTVLTLPCGTIIRRAKVSEVETRTLEAVQVGSARDLY